MYFDSVREIIIRKKSQGVPLPPLQKNFIADLDELEHAKNKKKSCENVKLLG